MIKVVRPWGYYIDYHRTDNCVMKKIVIYPGQSISKQYHNNRDEFWYIQSGDFEFSVNSMVQRSSAPMTYLIKAPEVHKVSNIGKVDLVIYEMQFGDMCDEADIVRVEDQYNRITVHL